MVYFEPDQPELYQGRNLDAAYHRFAHRHRVELVHAYDEARVEANRGRFDGRGLPACGGLRGAGRGRRQHASSRVSFYGPGPAFETKRERVAALRRLDALPGRDAAGGADVPLPARRALPGRSTREVQRLAENVRSNPGPGGKLPLFLTKRIMPEFQAVPDIWSIPPQAFDIARRRGRAGAGPPACRSTTAGRPQGPTPVIDAPATEARAMAWAAFKHDVDLYFYWHGVHWRHNRQKQGERNQNVWANPITFDNRGQPQEARRGPGLDQRRRRPALPGEEKLHPEEDRGIAGPIGTLQLANLRRGLQDHQYLTLARQARPGGRGEGGARRGRAARLLGRGGEVGFAETGESLRGGAAGARTRRSRRSGRRSGDERTRPDAGSPGRDGPWPSRRRTARQTDNGRSLGARPGRRASGASPPLPRRARPVRRPARAQGAVGGGGAALRGPAGPRAVLAALRRRVLRAPGARGASGRPADPAQGLERATSATSTARWPSTGSTATRASTPPSRTRWRRTSWPAPSGCWRCPRSQDPDQASYHNHTVRELALAVFSLAAVEGHPSVEGARRAAARAGLAGVRQPARADRAREPGRRLPRVDRLHAHHVGAARDDGRGAPHGDRPGPGRALVGLPQHGHDLPLQGAARRERGPRRRRRVPAPRLARQRRPRLRRPPLQGPLRGLPAAAARLAPRRVGQPRAAVPVERPRGRPARPRDHGRERAAAPPPLPRHRATSSCATAGARTPPGSSSPAGRTSRSTTTWTPPPRHLPQGLPGDRRRRRLHRHREPALPQPLPAHGRPQLDARLPAGRDRSSGARTGGRPRTTAASAWTPRASGTACAASRTGAARATCGTG